MSTTLITFRLQVHSSVRSVEILGSWDNFAQAYPLKRDRRTGSEDWRGCHTFKNISCDGDLSTAPIRRDGGLMMGGKYWYYYRLDGDLEYHDPAEPHTTSCPFLPGQNVNVLDVPVQFNPGEDPFRQESTNSIRSTLYTMDPEAKYISTVPSARRTARLPFLEASHKSRPSVAKVPPLVTARSLPAIFSAASYSTPSSESVPAEPLRAYPNASLSSPRHTPLLVAFQNLRGTKSAHRNELQECRSGDESLLKRKAWYLSLENLSGIGQNNRLTSNVGVKSAVSNKSPLRHTFRPQSIETGSQPGTNSPENVAPVFESAAEKAHLPSEPVPGEGRDGNSSAPEHGLLSTPGSPYYAPLEQLREHKSFEESAADRWNESPSIVASDSPFPALGDQSSIKSVFRNAPASLKYPPLSTHRTSSELRNDSFLLVETSFLDDESDHDPQGRERSIASSEDLHEIFSPGVAASTIQTDAMSPCDLSQPISPLRSDFGEALLDLRDEHHSEIVSKNLSSDFDQLYLHPTYESSSPSQPAPCRGSGGFEGYSLPEEEQTSVLTLRILPSSTLTSPSGDSPFSQQGSKDIVHSWNDGSEHRITSPEQRINMTALDELVEDLGYLGEMIV